ncbi:MAG: Flp pilus assembly complex ATPase component TadA [Candidatus Pacebacteria bacterium]|nr:Flp pilus assembly complex ATPase component TadA [Candidatus Paceibacterota bacterium]
MRVNDKKLKIFLSDLGAIPKDALEAAFSEAKDSGKTFGDVLLEKKLVPVEEMEKAQAYIFGVPFVELAEIEIEPEILKIISEPMSRQYSAIAFEKKDKQLRVAMLEPNDLQFIDFISKKTGLEIIPCMTNKKGIEKALKLFQKSLKAEFGEMVGGSDMIDLDDQDKVISKNNIGEKESVDLEKAAEDLPVIKIVDTLLKHAIIEGASDIHIEPEEKDVVIRYRVDGVLHDAMTLPRIILQGIVARIKILSNLKIDEHRLPQDGRFKIETGGNKVAFRVSILPVFDGEKIVMRLLNETSNDLTLEQIGFRERDLAATEIEIKKPNGMILVVGPTGSGKTTTLYTIAAILNTPDVNISTLEDPVEYRMPRINQSQVNSKINFTFASGLRTLLRQDPDIIMVGEIRDKETAELAVHAALTGHLVLSTLHTSSAAGTLPRLTDMGIESFLLASTANVIISQRLVRKICSECKEEFNLDKASYESLTENFNMDLISESVKKSGVIKKEYKNNKQMWLDIKFHRGKGCTKCRNGYKGRIGIFEVLQVNDRLSKLISGSAQVDEIEKASCEDGMTTMLEDGFIKIIQGKTTLEEVLRVTKE